MGSPKSIFVTAGPRLHLIGGPVRGLTFPAHTEGFGVGVVAIDGERSRFKRKRAVSRWA
jgi:hypothetical protein